MDGEIEQVVETVPATGETTQLEWRPVAGLAEICFKNFFLRIPTLGLYYFWGKTNLRRNLWGSVQLQGQPLEYTGKGWELFVGFLITALVVFLPLAGMAFGLTLLFGKMFGIASPMAKVVPIALVYIVFLYLLGVAQYRARNYRLSRTNWRGIRGHMAGSGWKYGWTFFWTTIVSVITLGWAMPWQATKLQHILTNDTRFGEEPLHFDAPVKPLYLPFAIAWFSLIIGFGAIFYLLKGVGQKAAIAKALNLPPSAVMSPLEGGLLILGIIALPLLYAVVSAFYISRKSNHFAHHTTIQNARFNLKTTPMSLIWLVLGNFFYAVLTLGLLSPIAQRRLASYIVGRASIEGAVDFDAIVQSQAKIAKTGEGLAEAFDIDAF